MCAQEDVGSLLILHGGVRWWHLTHDNLSKYMYKLHPSSVVRKCFQYFTRKMAFGKSHWIKKPHFFAPSILLLDIIASWDAYLELARPQRFSRNVMINYLETLREYMWFLLIFLSEERMRLGTMGFWSKFWTMLVQTMSVPIVWSKVCWSSGIIRRVKTWPWQSYGNCKVPTASAKRGSSLFSGASDLSWRGCFQPVCSIGVLSNPTKE